MGQHYIHVDIRIIYTASDACNAQYWLLETLADQK